MRGNGRGQVGEFYQKSALFHKNGPFLANIECCPKFLEYALEEGRTLYGEAWHFMGDLITPYKPCYIILPLKIYEWLFILSQ